MINQNEVTTIGRLLQRTTRATTTGHKSTDYVRFTLRNHIVNLQKNPSSLASTNLTYFDAYSFKNNIRRGFIQSENPVDRGERLKLAYASMALNDLGMVFLTKLRFQGSLNLNANRLIMLVLAQFVVALLSFTAPGTALVSGAQPIEQDTRSESESDSETRERSMAETDARHSRPRKAPSRLSKIFVKTISAPTPAGTHLSANKFGSFSRTGFAPSQPSVFRNIPLII